MEVWKHVEGFGGQYQVSDCGRVMSTHGKVPRILKPGRHRQGYLLVVLQYERFRKTYQVHRLVMETFNPDHKDGEEVNHIDGIKSNNCVSNLEWVSPSENVCHSFASGKRRIRLGEKIHNSILSDEDVDTICYMISNRVSRDDILSSFDNLSFRLYYSIRSRQNWKHVSCRYSW